MTMSFPYTDNKKFKIIINNFLTQNEIQYYYKKANNECNEEAYFCKGLYRGFFTDINFANTIKERLKDYLPNNIKKNFIVNDHFRMSKYELNSFLPIHEDRVNIFNGYKSIYTINIFLNTCIGGTSFWTQESYGIRHNITVPAIEGTAAVFDISHLHRGNIVKNQKKMLLRTDIMIPHEE